LAKAALQRIGMSKKETKVSGIGKNRFNARKISSSNAGIGIRISKIIIPYYYEKFDIHDRS
jgi:hypothetical protein